MSESRGIKEVFHITERKGKKSIWTKVGVALTNKDNSLNVFLSTLPIDGRLQIRDRKIKGDQYD